jgi:carbonic anhydrase/SulP family sulfate permease
VSGPAAGLTAVIAAQIAKLGTFEAFLTAVIIAGMIQIVLGLCKLGFITAFFPSSVIKGLLAAIGIILILKQIPYVIGYDTNYLGDEGFLQRDNQNTISEIFNSFFNIHPGAALVGILAISLLVLWDKLPFLKKSQIPAPLIVILLGVVINVILQAFGESWAMGPSHLVQVPIASSVPNVLHFLTFPDLSILANPTVYLAGVTIALVASLETLLNLEAVDKIDPLQRASPPNRELLAQGVGNVIAGLIGALPTTSVIVRSSVNINSGVRTKLSTIWHGLLLLSSVMFIPNWLNQIPLSALAGVLFVTGLKLASPKLIMQMWREGKNQFLPFMITVLAIVLTDLLIGVLIGLVTATFFILYSNMRRPLKTVIEKHATGDEVSHIELPNQVGFFHRASLDSTLRGIPRGSHVLIDAKNTDYIDPDVLDLITDYQNVTAPAYGVRVSLIGFKDKYPKLEDRIQYIDFSNLEVQASLTPEKVLEILKEGNVRFRTGRHLMRDVNRQLHAASSGQYPIAVVLGCIDSRTSTELIFDLSLGDAFSVRIAGNIVSPEVLGSIEYSCAIAGAKLILIMGHTSCGAVRSSVDLICNHKSAVEATGCANLDSLLLEIQQAVDIQVCPIYHQWIPEQKEAYYNEISYKNVLKTMQKIRKESSILDRLVREGKVSIVGAMYDVATGEVTFFQGTDSCAPDPEYKNKQDIEKEVVTAASE